MSRRPALYFNVVVHELCASEPPDFEVRIDLAIRAGWVVPNPLNSKFEMDLVVCITLTCISFQCGCARAGGFRTP